jgi:hypothetical protein
MSYEYKCVAGPTIVSVKHAKVRTEAVKAFEDIMNEQAAEGWEYVGIDEFHTSEPESWLSRKRVYVPTKMLVFRRAKAGATPVATAPVPAAMPAATPEPAAVPMSKVASLSDIRARLETDKL